VAEDVIVKEVEAASITAAANAVDRLMIHSLFATDQTKSWSGEGTLEE
jgi:hypothetical protein